MYGGRSHDLKTNKKNICEDEACRGNGYAGFIDVFVIVDQA